MTSWKLAEKEIDRALVEKTATGTVSELLCQNPEANKQPRYVLAHALTLDGLRVERRRTMSVILGGMSLRKIRKPSTSCLDRPLAPFSRGKQ